MPGIPSASRRGFCVSSDVLEASVGLALFYGWIVAHPRLFDFGQSVGAFLPGFSYSSLFMVCNAAILLIISLLYLLKRVVFAGKAYFFLMAAALILGCAAGAVGTAGGTGATVDPGPGFRVAAMLFCCVATSSATALLGLEQVRTLGALGSRKSVIALMLASASAACLLMVLSIPAIEDARFVPLLSALVSCVLAMRAQRGCKDKVVGYGRRSKLNLPHRFLCTAFVSDFACGVVGVVSSATIVSLEPRLSAVCYAGTATLLLVAALYLRFDFNNLLYRVAFLLVGFGFVLLAVSLGIPAGEAPGTLGGTGVSDISNAVGVVGAGLSQTGYRFTLAIVFVLSAWLIEQHELSANWVFPIVTCVGFLGQAVGSGLSVAAVDLFGEGSGRLAMCLLVAFAMPAFALLLLDIHNLDRGWGFCRPADLSLARPDRIDLACELLSKQFSLTSREAEVFSLIAKGHSRESIGRQLSLSKETVKSYANKMYAKVGVHSRQDLIELVGETVDGIEALGENVTRKIL